MELVPFSPEPLFLRIRVGEPLPDLGKEAPLSQSDTIQGLRGDSGKDLGHVSRIPLEVKIMGTGARWNSRWR
jgi:hypothetical protein